MGRGSQPAPRAAAHTAIQSPDRSAVLFAAGQTTDRSARSVAIELFVAGIKKFGAEFSPGIRRRNLSGRIWPNKRRFRRHDSQTARPYVARQIHTQFARIRGSIGAQYFRALPGLISAEAGEEMKPDGRSRRPPRDRANALLSFGYSLLMKDVLNAILVVGLDPSLGFYHQPRSQAHPLALDLMELFRVTLVDLPVVASINRRQWDADEDFVLSGRAPVQQVWLSNSGRQREARFLHRANMRGGDPRNHHSNSTNSLCLSITL